MTLIIMKKYALQARKMSNHTRIPYYTYWGNAFDALSVFFSNDSAILCNYIVEPKKDST